MKLITYEKLPPIIIQDEEHLEILITSEIADAKRDNVLNAIFLVADNGNEMSIVVGGDETVLSFDYGTLKTPYYASKGQSDDVEPVMTCWAFMVHHTEFPRMYVIPFKKGLQAVLEFLETNELPTCVTWMEV